MNPLYLTEADVLATLSMRDALRLLDEAARAQSAGEAENRPRQRVRAERTIMHVLPASYRGRLGHKTYVAAPPPRGVRFWYLLYAAAGELLAVLEADALGRIRTGAASGLATRSLAREDAASLAILGTGSQAPTQLEAVCAVRPIARVAVWGRDRARLERFCADAAAVTAVPVTPAESARDAVCGADVVCTITSAREPVLQGAWLQPGAHVNAAGSNRANAQEIDVETVARAALVAVEDVAQAKVESGDLLAAAEAGRWRWENAVLLSDVVAGRGPGRTDAEQITLFESLGIGLWDLAVASHVYDACVAAGRGIRLPIPA